MCASVCLSLRNIWQWLSVLVWDVFRQRTISKLLIRQFDFNETSGVDSRQQYKLSVKNGKIASYGFVIQFWIMSQFEYNLPFSTLIFVCGSYWLPVSCLQTNSWIFHKKFAYRKYSTMEIVCHQRKYLTIWKVLRQIQIFDKRHSFASTTNIAHQYAHFCCKRLRSGMYKRNEGCIMVDLDQVHNGQQWNWKSQMQ